MQVDSDDYLQDVVFNYYGNKMAVCSSDRKIKIYDKIGKEEKWEEVANWDVHRLIKIRHTTRLFGRSNGLILSLV